MILAAGESRRMGRDKALLPTTTGGAETFIGHLMDQLLEARFPIVRPIVIVLGHHAEEIAARLRSGPAGRIFAEGGAEIVRNENYAQGQLSSLQAAIRRLDREEPATRVDAALVCLVDHPGLTAEVAGALCERFRESRPPVVIPACQGRRGHPVLFASRLFAELLEAPLELGARSVVRRHAAEVALVRTGEEGVLWDVDTPQDYQAFLNRRTVR